MNASSEAAAPVEVAAAPVASPPSPVRTLSGPERVAAIILAMNAPTAQRLMRHFEPEQIKVIMKVASGLGQVPANQIKDLVQEFVDAFSSASDVVGNAAEIQKLLSGVLPKDQIDGIMNDVHDDANRSIWERISAVSEANIATYLMKEHPQTAALILSKINPRATARVLTQLPHEARTSITNRMLSLKPIIEATAKNLEAALQDNFITNFSRDSSFDTHSRMARIMNGMDRDHMEAMLQDIGAVRPKSVDILRGMLFTFEDIVKLTARDRSYLLEQVNISVVALALVGAAAPVRECVLSSMSARTRRVVESDMEIAEQATQREVLDARRSITELALELA